MKKYKIAINVLIIFVFVASIIALSVLCNTTHNHWTSCNEFYKSMLDGPVDDFLLEEYRIFYNETIYLTVSTIFSALSAVASAVTAVLLNWKMFKKEN